MTLAQGQMAGAAAGADAARDWQAVRHAEAIQFAPLPPIHHPAPSVPAWVEALMRIVEAIFAPIGRLLGMSWPAFRWVLIVLAALLALYILWRLVQVLIARRRAGRGPVAEEWAPAQAEAEALLSEADRLADEGHFGEAVHLLLRRSVQHIAAARPDLLMPASTAREIAALDMLPEAGRRAFAVIAARVERSLFGLRELDAADWQAARSAYADFAQVGLCA